MSYPGSKAADGVWQRIIGQIPPHPVYVEPFFGSGQIFHRKRPAAVNFLFDKSAARIAGLDDPAAHIAVHAVAGDAISLLPELTLPAAAMVYCDPPYPLETRQGRLYYEHEMSLDQHAQLLALLQALHCRVLLSTYPNPLYSAQLGMDERWRVISYKVQTRGGPRTEQLWANYPEPTELHDWRFAGRNYRERLTFQRLAARWNRRLAAMPARKRGFLLNALTEPVRADVRYGNASVGARIRIFPLSQDKDGRGERPGPNDA